jgi:hypothetical protein
MNPNIRADFPALGYRAVYPSHLLVRALANASYWQDAKNRFRIGTIGLSHDGQQWIVRVSADLVNKILPF